MIDEEIKNEGKNAGKWVNKRDAEQGREKMLSPHCFSILIYRLP